MSTPQTHCYWRWRFQPVVGAWGHLGLDYCLEPPHAGVATNQPSFFLRHVDYGLPGDCDCPGYRQSIALYTAMVARNGQGWPPLRTPHGRVFATSAFAPAPAAVGEFLLCRAPRFWGPCGAYRLWGPNSNTGLRRTLDLCAQATGYQFGHPPMRFRLGAWGYDWPGRLEWHDGPCPGYFAEDPPAPSTTATL